MKTRPKRRSLATDGVHVDARSDGDDVVEVDCGPSTGLIRIMPADEAHDLGKRAERRRKRRDKAAGVRHARRTYDVRREDEGA